MFPSVSVVMPVYNGEKYLKQAIESVIHQTLPDFEFIILDDGSTDNTQAILQEFAQNDARIRLYKNEINLGLSKTLNRGIELARSEYVARMDADDICLPERLEKQVQYMQTHTDVSICGSWAKIIGDREGVIWRYPCGHDEIYAKMLFNNYLVHPSVIMRTLVFRQHKLFYDSSATHIEDYDLWSRLLPRVRFANIPEPLLYYRLHGGNTSDLHGDKQREKRSFIYERFLSRLGMKYSQEDIILHERISSMEYEVNLAFLRRVRKWLEKIESGNERKMIISPIELKAELGLRWTQVCLHSQAHPFFICLEILFSRLPFRGRTFFRKSLKCIRFFLRRTIFVNTR